ncbi:hypothetical protein FOL47_010676 [Perkinsus chesapeaki]|uniref:Peptidase A1 domain-containing protein n=1 Tax=Perkinsus chesapeaki TaxID=330153 RepID=A0A7J6MP30_PERCH|nr:hypothetical protein FOL47_010676 [Perkinsus chesapeaki]
MDTGLSGTYVVYKNWYEKTYGKDACKQFPKGCYSCPGSCNPYAEEKHLTTFEDGTTMTSVLHQGTLVIGKHQLSMQFSLIIDFKPLPSNPEQKPENYIGLALTSRSNPQTVTSELYNKKIIKKYALSICSPGDVMSFTGAVIFGDWNGLCGIKSTVTTIPMTQPHRHPAIDSRLLSYGLVSPTGKTFTLQVQQIPAIYDTGTFSIALPKSIFDTLLENIPSMAGPGVEVKFIRGIWRITDKGYSSLPTLTFSVGDLQRPLIIRIPPKKYTMLCDGKWCALTITSYDGSDVILGRPYLTTYFSSYDLKPLTVSMAEYASGKKA